MKEKVSLSKKCIAEVCKELVISTSEFAKYYFREFKRVQAQARTDAGAVRCEARDELQSLRSGRKRRGRSNPEALGKNFASPLD
jgi:hypothetical protein